MKIEILYAKVCNLYGDQGNTLFLKQSLPQANFIETDLNDIPLFVSEKPDLVLLGAMSERMQVKVMDRLFPYRDRIKELIDQGAFFLITGNAFDLFGEGIEKEDGSFLKGLGIYPFIAKENLRSRHNSLVLGRFENFDIVGFKTQFTQLYPKTDLPYWLKMERGTGYQVGASYEGIHQNNFYGTNCVGPLLIMNPYFSQYFLSKMGLETIKLPYVDAMIEAYNQRVIEFKDPKIINHP